MSQGILRFDLPTPIDFHGVLATDKGILDIQALDDDDFAIS